VIWVIGSRGMLGSELTERLEKEGRPYIGTDIDVDIRDRQALRDFADGKGIQWIVNCSAYTAVDKAEDEEDKAFAINAQGAGNVALAAAGNGATLIHISTDYVFRGDATIPYVETDAVDPAGAYGRTKAEGERLVQAACPRHFILRTAWLYGRYGQNFVYTMLKLMSERDTLRVVQDQCGSPTWARDLAEAIIRIIAQGSESFGIYHYSGEGQTNWYEFAKEIHRLGRELGILKRDCILEAIKASEYPAKAHRPAWSVLSKEKIKTLLGVNVPDWRTSLETFMHEEKSLRKPLADIGR